MDVTMSWLRRMLPLALYLAVGAEPVHDRPGELGVHTQYLPITLVGDVPAVEFAGAWQAAIGNDVAARALMRMMHQADVMHGDALGRVLGQASLLS
jgi:hypothetical protein